jgi:hypothetical protein
MNKNWKGGNVCWQYFHDMLLEKETIHPLIKPKYNHEPIEEPTTFQSCTDDSFWAMRYDHVDLLYPWSPRYDNISFWFNANAGWEIMERCFPNGFLVDRHFRAGNPAHRYITDGVYPALVVDILDRVLPELGPWNGGVLLNHRCNVKFHPAWTEASPWCQRITQARFAKWLAGDYVP